MALRAKAAGDRGLRQAASLVSHGFVPDETAAALAPAPIVTSCTPNTGSTAGGTSITNLAGTGFVSGCTAAIDGINLPVTFVSSVKLTAVTPADAVAGAKNIVVTNPDSQTSGTTGNGLFTYVAPFDPTTLAPDGWWRGPFTGPDWVPTAPGDTHGNLVGTGTSPPGPGTPVNGIAPLHLNGVDQNMLSAQASSSFISATAGTMLVLFKAATPLSIAQAAWYSEFNLVSGNGSDLGFANSVNGVRGGNGGGDDTPYVPLSAGVWAACAFRVTGTTVDIRVSQASGTVDAAPTTVNGMLIDSFIKMGGQWSNAFFQKGDFLEVLLWRRRLSDAELANILGYFNTRYALALT